MPIDPGAIIEAIGSGLSKIPSGIFAAVLLAGPTVVWLIVRFANPRDAKSRHGAVAADLHWVCQECRSLNDDRYLRCYSCFLARDDAVMPLLATAATADGAGMRVAVGPGMPGRPQPVHWLEEDDADELDPAAEEYDPAGEEFDAADEEVEPTLEPVLVPVLAAAPEAVPVFEPLILEPRVKVARRPSSSRSARRD
jgi:glycine/D-amino acid oxidase-like deaminating enzyme